MLRCPNAPVEVLLEPEEPFTVPTRFFGFEQKCSGGERVDKFLGVLLGSGVVGVDVFREVDLVFLCFGC